MILHYHWENVTVNVPYHPYGSKWIDQHTKPCVQDVDYDYEVDITGEDVLNYLQLKGDVRYTANQLIELLEKNTAIDYTMLEDDADFVAFMLEHHEKNAIEEFEEGNEAY